jgi:hypothetical protein
VTVRFRTLIAAAVLGFACAALVACGDRSKLIPSGDAGRLLGDLDNVQNVVSSGDCERVNRALQQLQNDLVQLPSTVDVRLRNRLSEGVAALVRQAPEACEQAQTDTTTTDTTTTETTDTETETETTDTTPTETTPTETTPTETTPTETTPTETTPTETTPPPTEGTGGAGVPPGGTP